MSLPEPGRRRSPLRGLAPRLLLLQLAAAVATSATAAAPPSRPVSSGGSCLSAILAPGTQPLFATRQALTSGSDFANFHSLAPRFALYDDGTWLVQAMPFDGDRHRYGIAWGRVDPASVDAFRRFVEDPEVRAWLVCAAGDPGDFTAREREAGEVMVRVGGSLRIIPAGRLVAEYSRRRIASVILEGFRTLGDWVATLAASGEAVPDRAFVAYRTLTGDEKAYAPVNRQSPPPAWERPPGWPGVGNLYPAECRTAKGESRFWCDGWAVAEARGCGEVDRVVSRVNREGNVFVFEGSAREMALTPLLPGLPPLDPAVLLRQRP